MSNLAEGFERGSRSEFHQHIVVAKASCAEVRSDLHSAHDIGYLDSGHFERSMGQANEVAKVVNALRSAVQKRRHLEKNSQAVRVYALRTEHCSYALRTALSPFALLFRSEHRFLA